MGAQSQQSCELDATMSISELQSLSPRICRGILIADLLETFEDLCPL